MTSPDPTRKPPPAEPAEQAPLEEAKVEAKVKEAEGLAFGLSVHGIEFALGIVVLGALGWWADGALGWRDRFPVLLVTGILAGFAWGVWRIQRALGGRKPPRS